MVPESRVAFHAGSTAGNADSIGIVIVADLATDPARGHDLARTWSPSKQRAVPFDAGGMTLPQYRSVLSLVARAMSAYGITAADVVSHRSVSSGTSCPGSIWQTDAVFAEWRTKDLARHLACATASPTTEAFASCIEG
jgi:N-acetyl-anhydromuramyl-L-alanine amidase AmpD